MQMEECINCFNKEFSFEYSAKDRFHKLSGEFEIVKCKQCGIYCTRPQLSERELVVYYPENYICFKSAIDREPSSFTRFDRQIAMFRRRKQVEKRSRSKGKILDVGCATGVFLNEMKNNGWECFGVEPDRKASQYAREQFGLPVKTGYLLDTSFPDNYFDVVSFWDVLEHIQDPSSTLQEVLRILKPGGYLFFSLPNSRSIERSIFKAYWLGWDVPRHYRTFNSKNIKDYLLKQGFRNIKVRSFFGHHGVFMVSFSFWLNDIELKENVKSVLYKIMNSLVVRILSLPLFVLLDALNLSTIMGVSAKKVKNYP
jgi:SAM-dependent methyltransferase